MTTEEQQNNKRIAKNTLLLYFRMLFTMCVGLYTSRIVLQNLGVEDFGIYNVVGGVVAMFSLLSGSLSAAISRFFTYELGKGNVANLKKIFSSAISIQLILSVVIIILAETIGVWFLNNKMNIPEIRLDSANWVLHLSIATFCVNLLSVPYNAAIIAHERMSAFAYVSVFEVLGKLVIALGITFSPIDKLCFYAILMCLVSLVIRLIYGWYCKRHFEECECHIVLDFPFLKKMFGFAGWNFIGASSAVLRDQGGNILINLFCGPVVNAARGIAFQVNNAVSQFVNNFMVALNPQITKSYASENYSYMMTLIFRGARLSFFMLLLLSLPILFNTEYILSLWLKTVPEHACFFVQLVLMFAMSESISNPLITAMLATGDIRNYQIIVGGLQLMNLPVGYFLLKMGFFPEIVLIVAICISQLCLFARILLLKKMIQLDVLLYLKNVYLKVLLVSVLSSILPFVAKKFFITAESPLRFVCLVFLCIFCSTIVILFLGCDKEERGFIVSKIIALKKKVLAR